MITKQEIQHIAKLARLELSGKEIEKYRKEFSAILDYVGKLGEIEAEISDLTPSPYSMEITNVMRKDQVNAKHKESNAKLLELIPEMKNGYLKVKSILQ